MPLITDLFEFDDVGGMYESELNSEKLWSAGLLSRSFLVNRDRE